MIILVISFNNILIYQLYLFITLFLIVYFFDILNLIYLFVRNWFFFYYITKTLLAIISIVILQSSHLLRYNLF